MCFNGVSQWLPDPDAIMVLSSNLFTFDHAARFEIGDNPLDGSFGDSHLKCNFPKHHRRISGENHEDVRMVRQKGPLEMG